MNSPSIRQASEDDAKLLTDLAYTTFWDAFAHHPKNAPDDLAHYMRQAFSVEQITTELADEKSIFLIAEVDGEAAGYAKIIIDNIEDGITAERPIELSRLYSHQKFLGQGIGQKLMDACFERAIAEGCDVMWLGVWEFNPRAQRFYEKNGFTVVGKHVFQLGSDPQTDLLMERNRRAGGALGAGGAHGAPIAHLSLFGICIIVAFVRQITNPPNPYNRYSSEYVGEPPPTKLEIFEETNTKKVITKAFASDWEGGWRYTVNCYRGCVHGCTYCFARQYHEYLGYGAGTDFETKIVVKPNTPMLLRQELKKTRDKMPHIDFSFATDPYIALEAEYKLTRQCLEICAEFRVPTGVITKSALVTRDIDVLKKQFKTSVFFSLPFLTKEKSNPFEPYTPVPEARFRAMKMLADEGITVGIGIAPVIPGYNESDIPGLLERAKEAGATRAFMSMLHLDTDSIEEYFVQKMHERLPPTRVTKIINTMKRERGGSLRHNTYKERSTGKTEQWEVTTKLFEFHARRLGFRQHEKPEQAEPVAETSQPKLF